jgi:hypothetical protein
LTTTERTGLSGRATAASRLTVPMTLFSWIRLSPIRVESTTNAAWMIVST